MDSLEGMEEAKCKNNVRDNNEKKTKAGTKVAPVHNALENLTWRGLLRIAHPILEFAVHHPRLTKHTN
jgi:hypothetical protein